MTLNKVNTLAWFKERVYKLDKPDSDRISALKRAFDEKFAVGVLFEEPRPVPKYDIGKTVDVSGLL